MNYTTAPSQEVDISKSLELAMKTAINLRGNVNLLIAGKTGVGKSTLINAVFHENLAETGQGKPVTPTTREIKKEGFPLTIFDSRGLEVAKYKETICELENLIKERCNHSDPNRHIHIAWVCICEDIRRVEDADQELVEMLSRYVPVVGVITKARADNGFRAEVQQQLYLAKNVVRVRAISEQLDDGHLQPIMGLKELIDITMQIVPEGQRNAVAAAQKVSLREKVKRSHLIVTTAATSAAGVGAVPIPFSHAVALVPVQMTMLASISAVFGLDLSQASLGTLISSVIAGGGGTLGGHMLLGGLAKLIPGAGSLVGGVLAGSTAALLTTLFGEAYIAALCAIFGGHPDAQPTPQEVAETFKTELSRNNFPVLSK
ncbi:MAG: GTPase [Limnoraphis sp.]